MKEQQTSVGKEFLGGRRSLVLVLKPETATYGWRTIMWGGVFTLSLSFGLVEQRFNDSTRTEISHIQFHHPKFSNNYEIEFNNKVYLQTERVPMGARYAPPYAIVYMYMI